jgi:hypothetical protein
MQIRDSPQRNIKQKDAHDSKFRRFFLTPSTAAAAMRK